MLPLLVASLAVLSCATPEPGPADIDRLIRQLGSDRFPERQAASRELDEIGAAALPFLRKAARSEDPEVRRRVEALLISIPDRVQVQLTDAVQKLGGQANVNRTGGTWETLLDLSGTKAGDADLALLQWASGLWRLDLSETRVTDAGLAHLHDLENLLNLSLARTGVSDAGLARLSGLGELRTLNLSGTRVTGPGLSHLDGLKNLWRLDLSKTPLADAELHHLGALAELRHLTLAGTPLTDAGLARLKGLRELQFLDLEGTRVTEAGVAGLQQALPKARIVR